MAAYFNVTTDYLLEISDVKRDVVVGTVEMGRTLEKYCDLVELYRGQEQCDQVIILASLLFLRTQVAGKSEKSFDMFNDVYKRIKYCE